MQTTATGTTTVDHLLGSGIPYITYAVPLFFILIAIELIFSILAGRKVYRLNDSVNDLSCGVMDRVVQISVEAVVLAAYIFIYENYRMFDFASWSAAAKWGVAFALFLGVDFCFYWHHRFGHEWAIGWATHVVHHQSEEFNFIVALRQSSLEHHLVFFFYLPLALLGFPPSWYVAMFSLNLIWQFFCHTRFVGKLGPLEWILNTPSHHRVHHGRNPKYLDKNYAGTLIIWDRMFGTFQEEEEEPVYGITKPLHSWNPLWANYHVWYELGREAWYAPYWWDKIRIWFMPLGWVPRGLPAKPDPPEVDAATVIKYDMNPPKYLMWYALFHFAIATMVGLYFLIQAEHTPVIELWDPIALLMFTLLTVGGILELRPWTPQLETIRLFVIPIWVGYRTAGTEWMTASIATAAGFSILSALFVIVYAGYFTNRRPMEEDPNESPTAISVG